MIEMGMAAELIARMPSGCGLTWVGDYRQLPAVGAGRVFGDVLEATGSDYPSVVELSRDFRFAKSSGVSQMARLIREKDDETLIERLENGDLPGVEWIGESDAEVWEGAIERKAADFVASLKSGLSSDKKKQLRQTILTVLKTGKGGSDFLNERIDRRVRSLLDIRPSSLWYESMPILVTRNLRHLGLANGDLGNVRRESQTAAAMVEFEPYEGKKKSVPWFQLESRALGYAFTVHKSQGNEYDAVDLILPETVHPLATREMLYTGVTRTRGTLRLFSSHAVLKACFQASAHRKTGLRRRLQNALADS